MPSYLTVADAAAELGAPKRRILRAIQSGNIPHERIGQLIVLQRDALPLIRAAMDDRAAKPMEALRAVNEERRRLRERASKRAKK